MAKIIIVAPAEADDDVKDAVKILKAAGHDVDTEEPTPKSLLHVLLGLCSPSAYGFGPSYVISQAGGDVPPTDDDENKEEKPPKDEKPSKSDDDTAALADDTSSSDAGGDDDFNFESLGTVKIDGELIEAEIFNSETSVLCVESIIKGPKTTYSLNESVFSFWPANPVAPTQRVEVLVDNHHTSVELPIQESTGKAVLKVGSDLISMFESHSDDDEFSVKVGDTVKNIQPMRAGKAYAKFGSPAKVGDEGKVTKINNLRDIAIVQFKKSDGTEVYTHIQNLK